MSGALWIALTDEWVFGDLVDLAEQWAEAQTAQHAAPVTAPQPAPLVTAPHFEPDAEPPEPAATQAALFETVPAHAAAAAKAATIARLNTRLRLAGATR